MLVVTEPKVIYELYRKGYIDSNSVIYNLNANTTQFNMIRLMPPQGMNTASLEFDQYYINLILSDNNYFIQFMNIIIPLRDGKDVYILAYNEDTVFNPITETLMKFIQQRYGYDYQEVHYMEDINMMDLSSFTTPGIIQFDEDFNTFNCPARKFENFVSFGPEFPNDEKTTDQFVGSCHQRDEGIKLESLILSIAIYAEAIVSLCS